MTSVTQAVATTESGPTALIRQYRDDFAQVLPSHVQPDTWVRLMVGVLRRDAKLREAAESNPASLMAAALDAARQGLEPGSDEYYLTPRKVKGRLEVLGIRGYVGEIKLMYNSGKVASVVAEVVRTNDRFEFSPGRDERPRHDIDWDSEDRGDLRLVYAFAVTKDGATSKVVVLNRGHIKTAMEYSQGSSSEYSPWKKHPESMWLKTAVHRLRVWVPTSAEQVANVKAHEATSLDVAERLELPPLPPYDPETGEVLDAELVENGEVVE